MANEKKEIQEALDGLKNSKLGLRFVKSDVDDVLILAKYLIDSLGRPGYSESMVEIMRNVYDAAFTRNSADPTQPSGKGTCAFVVLNQSELSEEVLGKCQEIKTLCKEILDEFGKPQDKVKAHSQEVLDKIETVNALRRTLASGFQQQCLDAITGSLRRYENLGEVGQNEVKTFLNEVWKAIGTGEIHPYYKLAILIIGNAAPFGGFKETLSVRLDRLEERCAVLSRALEIKPEVVKEVLGTPELSQDNLNEFMEYLHTIANSLRESNTLPKDFYSDSGNKTLIEVYFKNDGSLNHRPPRVGAEVVSEAEEPGVSGVFAAGSSGEQQEPVVEEERDVKKDKEATEAAVDPAPPRQSSTASSTSSTSSSTPSAKVQPFMDVGRKARAESMQELHNWRRNLPDVASSSNVSPQASGSGETSFPVGESELDMTEEEPAASSSGESSQKIQTPQAPRSDDAPPAPTKEEQEAAAGTGLLGDIPLSRVGLEQTMRPGVPAPPRGGVRKRVPSGESATGDDEPVVRTLGDEESFEGQAASSSSGGTSTPGRKRRVTFDSNIRRAETSATTPSKKDDTRPLLLSAIFSEASTKSTANNPVARTVTTSQKGVFGANPCSRSASEISEGKEVLNALGRTLTGSPNTHNLKAIEIIEQSIERLAKLPARYTWLGGGTRLWDSVNPSGNLKQKLAEAPSNPIKGNPRIPRHAQLLVRDLVKAHNQLSKPGLLEGSVLVELARNIKGTIDDSLKDGRTTGRSKDTHDTYIAIRDSINKVLGNNTGNQPKI